MSQSIRFRLFVRNGWAGRIALAAGPWPAGVVPEFPRQLGYLLTIKLSEPPR